MTKLNEEEEYEVEVEESDEIKKTRSMFPWLGLNEITVCKYLKLSLSHSYND